MDSKRFHWYYDLMHDSIMHGIPIPNYCVNRVCVCWSSPRYCYQLFIEGKKNFPVCVRSAIMYNLKKLPPPRNKAIQLEIDFVD